MKSVLQDWVMGLGLRHQGVLISAVRGADTLPRDEPTKLLSRCLRCDILVPAVGDPAKSISFIEQVSIETLQSRMVNVLRSFDHLPLHYWMHFVHAAEVVGYYCPHASRESWWMFYAKAADKLHLNPESKQELDERLNADELTFGAAQRTEF